MNTNPRPALFRPCDLAAAGLLLASVVWTTLCLGGFRPETKVLGHVLAGLALTVHLAGRAVSADGPGFHRASWAVMPFLGYAAFNSWQITPVSWLGWRDWLTWAHLAAAFWIGLNTLDQPPVRRLTGVTLGLLGAVAVALAVYQRVVDPEWLMLGRFQATQFLGRSSGPFGIPNSLAAFMLLLLPPAAMLARDRAVAPAWRVCAGLGTVAFGLGLFLTISRGAWLALAVALTAWPLLYANTGWARRLGRAAGALLGVALLGSALYAAHPLVRERVDLLVAHAGETSRPIMWRGAWRLFSEAPWMGTGAGSYNVLFEAHRPQSYQDEPLWAHNDYLNTLSDYGLFGFALSFGLAAYLYWAVGRCLLAGRDDTREAAQLRALAIGWLAFGLSLFVDFHLKLPALALVAGLYAAELSRRVWTSSPGAPWSRGWRAVCACAAAAVLYATVAPLSVYRGEALRRAARSELDRAAAGENRAPLDRVALTRIRAEFEQATRVDPGNAHAWADLAYAIALQARTESAERALALGQQAEAAADRALAQSAVVPEFWLRRGVARDLQRRWSEAGADFSRAIELAPHSASVWYYQAYHLSLHLGTRSLAVAAADVCLRLDGSHPQAKSLRDRLAGHLAR